MTQYTVKSPVLLLIFNRPDFAAQVFHQIRAVKPARLYIGADGPRAGHATDAERCRQAREIVSQVDWDCTVKTLFREENVGCKAAVAGAITWFFEQEEEGIILEDDCLPIPDFFYFCDTLLEKYRYDTRIRNITGNNTQDGQRWGDASYYFSQYSNIWGWATWRRVWKDYDSELRQYKAEEVPAQLKKVFSDPFLVDDWVRIFKTLQAGVPDIWDYQFILTGFFENGLCATPNVNLVRNIGWGPDATHTFEPENHNANRPFGELGAITHPRYFLPEKDADYYWLAKEFGLAGRWQRYNKRTKKFKRWVRRLFS